MGVARLPEALVDARLAEVLVGVVGSFPASSDTSSSVIEDILRFLGVAADVHLVSSLLYTAMMRHEPTFRGCGFGSNALQWQYRLQNTKKYLVLRQPQCRVPLICVLICSRRSFDPERDSCKVKRARSIGLGHATHSITAKCKHTAA